jgi:GntR family carbon starvation induced transcriptional regulator
VDVFSSQKHRLSSIKSIFFANIVACDPGITGESGGVRSQVDLDPPKTLSDEAYRRLRDDLIAGRLVPGSRLRVERLKADYDIGASPLREALSRLASEGLVTAEGQRGFRASQLSLDDLADITRMRIFLETQAIEESVARGDDAWEARVVAAHHHLAKAEPRSAATSTVNFSDWEQRNRAFHDSLVAACTSRWLLHFREVIYDQHERYRRIAISHPEIPRDVRDEHRLIFEAALARDIPNVTRLSADHISRTSDLVRELLRKANGFARSVPA